MTVQFKYRGSDSASVVCSKADELSKRLGIPDFVARIMVARQITDLDQAQHFLNPSLKRDWRNPYEIDGLYEAVDRIESAIKNGERIVIYGDFDVDGITSTTVMTRAIRELGGTALPFIPSRFEEGYGLSVPALDRTKELRGDLLVTVDCGISGHDEVEYAKELGMDVIITDHHEVGSSVPEGVPIVDPKGQEDIESSILAGVGVALKVVQALGSRFAKPHLWRQYTDFATLGTVADLMPLTGENRALVADGINRMRKNPRACIMALASVAGCTTDSISSTSLSFSLIPRINAAGRMDNVELALHLMLSDVYEDAAYLAEELDILNNRRREIEAELSEVAIEIAERDCANDRAIVVAGEGWHEGVKGIVASKLTGAFGAPSILFTIEGDVARGSGRSIGDINLFKAVESASELLTKFGGHSAAVGVTLPTENLPAFREALNSYMSELPEEAFFPKCDIDALVELEELDIESVEGLERLAPFGNANPSPVLLARNVTLGACKAVGADKTHLSCELSDGNAKVKGIMFRCEGIDSLLEADEVADVAFCLQIDEWRGRRSVKAVIEEIATSRSCSGLEGCLDSEVTGYIDNLFSNERTEGAKAPSNPDDGSLKESLREEAERDPEALKAKIIKALIKDEELHDSQRGILQLLSRGRSVLAVMGTGRGKSLIFQAHAAFLALSKGACSLFVYPLRALMADQAFHLQRKFKDFGIVCKVLNGHTPEEERQAVYQGIASGEVDIVLTTPEYLSYHASQISQGGMIEFAVIDEAHHIGQAKAGTRPAYRALQAALKALGSPQVLAVTATANADIAAQIKQDLKLDDIVTDNSERANLIIDDKRNIRDRDNYLARIVASGEKCVIYVNSREQSIRLARTLRCKVAQLAPMIGFYNAGLSRDDRERVERLFREGDIRTLVATSAFGEGIDIPDIRHVVLYHMPFSDIEFNQMSGRAGRDGKDAYVHLLFSKRDATINNSILSRLAPDRDSMAHVYRHLRKMQRSASGALMSFELATLARELGKSDIDLDLEIIDCGIRVFSELGLIDVSKRPTPSSEVYELKVVEGASKVQLSDSLSYREGLDEIESFLSFKKWALKCDPHSLQVRIIHPISPDTY